MRREIRVKGQMPIGENQGAQRTRKETAVKEKEKKKRKEEKRGEGREGTENVGSDKWRAHWLILMYFPLTNHLAVGWQGRATKNNLDCRES